MSVLAVLSAGSERQNAAAKKRRRKQNGEIDELAELLPFRRSDGMALDKLSTLRLIISFFKFQNFMTLVYGTNGAHKETVLTSLVDQAMDGFLMVVASDGVILYASDNMESFVALNPRDVIGHSLHDLVQSQQDRDTITNNLKHEGNKPSQYRMFCLELQNPSPSKASNKMLLQLSGHLKVAVSLSPSPTPSPGQPPNYEVSPAETIKPHVLGLVVECRPISKCLSILEMDIPYLAFTTTIALDWMLKSVDMRLRDVLGFDPEDFVGFSYKNYLCPGDSERLKNTHEFLMRTGYVCSPPYRILSASGDWAWVQSESILRYHKKTHKPSHYETLFKLVSQPEGTRRYIEQKQLSGCRHGNDEMKEMSKQHTIYALPCDYNCSPPTNSHTSAPSPSHSISANEGTSPSSSVAIATTGSTPQQPDSSSPPASASLEVELGTLSTPPQQQQHLPPPPPPPPPSQEWVERQRQLQEQIQRQQQLLQDLLVEQEFHQMMRPGQLETTGQESVQELVQNHIPTPSPLSSAHSGSLSSLTPSPLSLAQSGPLSSLTPSPLSLAQSGPLSSLTPSPLSLAQSGPLSSLTPSPLLSTSLPTVPPPQVSPPKMTNGGHSGLNHAPLAAGSVSFLGSVDLFPSRADSESPLSPDIQELLQQFM